MKAWRAMRGLSGALLTCLTACSQHTLAPVVSAWSQPSAAESDYRVRPGDTLYSIAWSFGLDYRALARVNHLVSPYSLRVGQPLKMTTLSRLPAEPEKPQGVRVVGVFSSQRVASPKRTQGTVFPARVSRWVWPVQGHVVEGFDPASGGNHGINIAGRLGESVRAVAAGEVVYSGDGVRGYSNLIIIKHTRQFLSAYAYNQINLVREGTSVRQGQTIARMGANNAGSVMLHFEIRKDGRPVNPMHYLR